MPELPEVETMKRGIAAIVGSRVRAVVRPRCQLRPIEISPALARFRSRVVGRTVAGVDRIGKRVIVELGRPRAEGGDAIVFEPRMTGLVLVAEPPNCEHLRFGLELEGGPAPQLWFWDRRGLGSVRLFSAAEFDERFGLERVGPDALVISAEKLAERLGPSRREIKVALLDQRAVAGIGNLYASEILHVAGIHPRRRCDGLRLSEWQALHAATRLVLEEAIRFEGSTLSDGTYRNALNEAGGYQNHHRVYDRADQPCPRCATVVVREVQAQRATFFCKTCQPRRRRR